MQTNPCGLNFLCKGFLSDWGGGVWFHGSVRVGVALLMHHDTAKKQTPPRLRVPGKNLHVQHFFTVVMSKTQETLVNLWGTRTRVAKCIECA
jgi:hypothetical protein